MFYDAHRGKGKAGEGWPVVQEWLRTVIDYLACAYMILVLAVLPLYCPGGYTYIATRKNSLFGRGGVAIGKVLAPTLLAYGAVSLILYMKRNKASSFAEDAKRLWSRAVGGISAVDIFAAWYGIALTLSFLCTEYEEAGWGAYGWYMGYYTQMIMVCSYFLISKFWKPRKAFFHMMLIVSAVVFLLGYLNRFSIYPIEMKDANVSFISTIGNMNWYCGYVTTVFFGGVALLWQRGGRGDGSRDGTSDGEGGRRKRWRKVGLACYVLLGFATLVTQGSASGILTLCVLLPVLFCLSAGDGGRMQGFGVVWMLLSAACLFTGLFRIIAPEALNYRDGFMDLLTMGAFPVIMMITSGLFAVWIRRSAGKGLYRRKELQLLARIMVTFVSCAVVASAALVTVNTLRPGSIGKLSEYEFFTFSDSWASSRGATWKCGFRVFAEQDPGHKLTGVGPDAMAAYIYDGGAGKELSDMIQDNFGTAHLTNAHNEWLTILADVGLLGLAGFSGMMVSAIGIMLGKGKQGRVTRACGLCLLAYTVNNIFSFQQVVNTPLMFAVLGMGMAFRHLRDWKTVTA